MSLLKAVPSKPIFAPFRGQNLLIDADDTLWENNVYFEQAIAAFIEHLDHHHHSPAEVRSFLNEVERQSVLEHGYGLHSFRHSLLRCFQLLSPAPLTPAREQEIVRFTGVVEDHVIELLPGVAETLPQLAADHRLFLMTKGNFMEQTSKLKRSGLEQYFSGVEITVEKSAAAYRAVIEKFKLSAEITWMIGNSPRSDINPALEAGLNAVFVPHSNTWVLERDEIQAAPVGQTCLRVQEFADLRGLFCYRNHEAPMV